MRSPVPERGAAAGVVCQGRRSAQGQGGVALRNERASDEPSSQAVQRSAIRMVCEDIGIGIRIRDPPDGGVNGTAQPSIDVP